MYGRKGVKMIMRASALTVNLALICCATQQGGSELGIWHTPKETLASIHISGRGHLPSPADRL
jgi:hypothetical protein